MRENFAYWLAQVQKYVTPDRLALVRTYYPPVLAAKIIACCEAQLRGEFRRCCRDRYCPACSMNESRKIARKQYRHFEACTPTAAKMRLAHDVFTLPPELRARLVSVAGWHSFRLAVLDTLREVHGADVAGVMNFHAHGDDDIRKFHPHWDVVTNGYLVTATGKTKQHRPPFVHHDDVREIYRRNLTRHFGLAAHEEPEKVDWWCDTRNHRVFNLPWKVRHVIRYSARNVYQPHLAWLVDNGPEGDWYYMPNEKKGEVCIYEGSEVIHNFQRIEHMLYRKRRRVWFGYMQDRSFAKSAAAFGQKIAQAEQSEDE
ncbi:MAG: hypothetical protein QOE90_3329 [Thermoplasmata archaeon]|jgi:hypothetical protein|nr:hypothetical protein [Thermoplasmata archaeon]